MGAEKNCKDSDMNDWLSTLPYEKWVALPVSGSRPSPRYKHCSVVANGKLYVVGGSRNGRYLADIQVLDLKTLAWSTVELHVDPNSDTDEKCRPQNFFPATSGHSAINWGNKLILLSGHSKESSDFVTVWSVDLETHYCSIVKTSGKAPIARGGQSVTLVGSRLIMFGGEDTRGRLLNDIHVLDLETMKWNVIETVQTPPSPRFDHTATVHAERYLLVFGGCSHSTCFSDFHILDLEMGEWSRPQVQGAIVTPRAGHAGTTIGESWYIVGGGDNKSGASETLVLNMSKLVWSVLNCVKERDPLASEGLSLCSASFVNGEKFLVAFGGYSGKYTNEVFVLRLKPRDSSRPKIFQSPAAAAAAASVSAAYALTKTAETNSDVTSKEDAATEWVKTEGSQSDRPDDIDAIMEAKKMLEMSLAEIREEKSRIKEELDEMNGTHDELSKELLSVRSQLAAEISRCFKLEAQIAELRMNLKSLQSIEDELQLLRSQDSTLEQDAEFGSAGASQRQSSGGVWQWLSGGSRNS